MLWDGVTALVARAKQGDTEALERLYQTAQPYLLRLAQRTLGPGWPEQSLSDLTQETWIRAWQAIGDFQGADNDADTGALLRAWFARTMKRAWLNQIRHENAQRRKPTAGLVSLMDHVPEDSRPGLDPAATDPTPSENVREQEGRFLLEQALEKLTDSSDREVVRLRFFEGLSFTQIGERLGRDESTIRSRLPRVLDFLGTELKAIS
jgi:RNA polymerase sigma factor (sigma-70 family)